MSGHRHLRVVPALPEAPRQQAGQTVLTFAGLTAEERGADAEPLKPTGEILDDELNRIARRLRARGGLG